MATYTRKNAWNQNGTFSNSDLLWYAKGVRAMQARALNDQASWWFFAAIHNEYLSGQTTFPGWAYISAPPAVPTSPLPSQSIRDKFWNQCQHQSWYFEPWHRGYLIAIEAQIRAIVIGLGGPNDWSLPYWNYFGPGNQYKIPPAFTQLTLPDGSPNPLFVKARYGPRNNGDIYIPLPPVSQDCQRNTIYTGSNAVTPNPGYGGPSTGFSNAGSVSGNLENNPHNMVHTYIGGSITSTDYGLMSDPGTAALDPIFYLHHCNIDRMWASWNAAGNANPTSTNWLKGPAATGGRKFVMPMPSSRAGWVYTPNDMKSLSQLNYVYDNLSTGITKQLVGSLAQRLTKLGVNLIQTQPQPDENMDMGGNSEMVGANEGALTLKNSGARTAVRFQKEAWAKVPKSLMNASVTKVPDHVYLQLENVKGKMDSNVLAVSVNHKLAGHVSLFGLRKASSNDGHHGGAGLTFILDITNLVDELHLNNALDADSLDVTISPDNDIPNDEEITVGRVSLHRQPQS
ncbi:tyrosinase family protein [Mucilaginibacter endophyticus]|uniref:tyrosinase family protein n=1 Tax=Mucilaginibacter endophyticus TaxID=2675003 RepID=UPI000E0CE72D|nr:tyrosinase family protein [Mucilaginibacter endophyticus]